MAEDTSILCEIFSFLDEQDYDGAIKFLEDIIDKEKRHRVCYKTLIFMGLYKIVEEFGEIEVNTNREEYQRARIGVGDCSPHSIFYTEDFRGENSKMEGLEKAWDIIPEDNPLKIYYTENFEEGEEKHTE